jgi:hypothetical protein
LDIEKAIICFAKFGRFEKQEKFKSGRAQLSVGLKVLTHARCPLRLHRPPPCHPCWTADWCCPT